MRLSRCLIAGLAALALGAGVARADTPSPLRLLPAKSDFVIQVASPRNLVETLTGLEQFKELLKLDAAKELLDSTSTRRAEQMVGYFERKLGRTRMELLDDVGAGGVALASTIGKEKPPFVLVMQGKDEKSMRKLADLALDVLEQEIARQEGKVKPVKGTHNQIETISIGKEFHVAVAGSALIISNSEASLKASLDCHTGKEKKSLADNKDLAASAKLLPKGPLATLWVNMAPVRIQPDAEPLYKTPRDPFITIVLGGWVSVATKAPYLCVGLYKEKDNLLTTVRMPAGRGDMGADRVINVAPDKDSGSRPLLKPKDTLFSYSFYMDFSKFWTDRKELFGEKTAAEFEKADKDTSRLPGNLRLSKVLTSAGAYHRIVVVNQPKSGYKTKQPRQPIPAFAFITEPHKAAEFKKTIEPALRAGALFGGAQFSLKLVEEKYKGCDIVGYRFPEDREFKQDVNDIRYAFSPCFVSVGDQYVFCSTIELCKELVDLLQKEAKEDKAKGSAASSRMFFYSSGVAALLKDLEDQLLAQTILGQAATIEEAKKQVKELMTILDKSGGLSLETTYGAKHFQYDVRLRLSK